MNVKENEPNISNDVAQIIPQHDIKIKNLLRWRELSGHGTHASMEDFQASNSVDGNAEATAMLDYKQSSPQNTYCIHLNSVKEILARREEQQVAFFTPHSRIHLYCYKELFMAIRVLL